MDLRPAGQPDTPRQRGIVGPNVVGSVLFEHPIRREAIENLLSLVAQPTSDRAPGALDEAIALLTAGRLRLRAHSSLPMQQAAEAHRQLESGNVHERLVLTLE